MSEEEIINEFLGFVAAHYINLCKEIFGSDRFVLLSREDTEHLIARFAQRRAREN